MPVGFATGPALSVGGGGADCIAMLATSGDGDAFRCIPATSSRPPARGTSTSSAPTTATAIRPMSANNRRRVKRWLSWCAQSSSDSLSGVKVARCPMRARTRPADGGRPGARRVRMVLMFIAILDFSTATTDRPAALAQLDREHDEVRAMPGNRAFRVYASRQDDTAITVVHEWDDE